MIDTFPNLLFYIDTRGHYLGCNSAFTTLTGKNLKDLAGKTNAEIGSPCDVDLFERYNAELLDQSGIRTYTGLFHHMDKTYQKSLFRNQQ